MYDLLFAAACNSLLELGESRLGARIGVRAVLHTWTRKLLFHPHVHCVVTGGGLATTEDRWTAARRDYLFSVRALAQLYRGKFLAALADTYERGELDLVSPPVVHHRTGRRYWATDEDTTQLRHAGALGDEPRHR